MEFVILSLLIKNDWLAFGWLDLLVVDIPSLVGWLLLDVILHSLYLLSGKHFWKCIIYEIGY